MKKLSFLVGILLVISACSEEPKSKAIEDVLIVAKSNASENLKLFDKADGHWITSNSVCRNLIDISNMSQFKFKAPKVTELSEPDVIEAIKAAIKSNRLNCLNITMDELNVFEFDNNGTLYKLAVTNDKRAMLRMYKDDFDLLIPYEIEKLKTMKFEDPFTDEKEAYDVIIEI